MGLYSNGYDFTKVTTALKGRIGWRQPLGSSVPTLTTAVKDTASGRYFQDFHALVTVQNVKSTMEQIAASDGDLCTHLLNIEQAAIMRCLNGVFNGREPVEQVLLFNRRGQSDELIENTGLFVGYEINVAKLIDRAVQIDSCTLYFDGAATFELHLFVDGQPEPLSSWEVTTEAGKATVVDFQDLVLTYLAAEHKGSRFYFGYFQDDLGAVKAIREQVECWNKTLCFSARPMTAEPVGATGIDSENRVTTWDTQGINLEVSTFTDHTQQIVRRAHLFDEAVGLTVAYAVLEQIAYANRSNATERVMKDNVDRLGLSLDMHGVIPASDSPQTTGLKQRIDRELKDLKAKFYPKPKAQVVNQC